MIIVIWTYKILIDVNMNTRRLIEFTYYDQDSNDFVLATLAFPILKKKYELVY